jgi:hypothetical protein
MKCVKAVIYVMDAAHRERLPEAHSELVKLVSEKELKDASLLILANKQVTQHPPSSSWFKLRCCSSWSSRWQ